MGAAAWWAAGCPGSDIEEVAQQLRDQGWSEAAIQAEYDEAELLAEPGLIWPDNWIAAQVFLCCQWSRIVGMEKTIFEGIPTQEIVASMLALRVPRRDWPETARGVRVMVAAAMPVLNARKG